MRRECFRAGIVALFCDVADSLVSGIDSPIAHPMKMQILTDRLHTLFPGKGSYIDRFLSDLEVRLA
jgi:hypothetical protein